MAVYKLFPEKDATIYSEYELKNTGIDEILELDLAFNSDTPTGVSSSLITETSRYLLKFPDSGISDIIDNKISGAGYKAYLKLRSLDPFLNNKCFLSLLTKSYFLM